jgi:hypothetical protein
MIATRAPSPRQQWRGEDGNALFEAGGECFLMAGQFNRKYSNTSASTELSPVTTNGSLLSYGSEPLLFKYDWVCIEKSHISETGNVRVRDNIVWC